MLICKACKWQAETKITDIISSTRSPNIYYLWFIHELSYTHLNTRITSGTEKFGILEWTTQGQYIL